MEFFDSPPVYRGLEHARRALASGDPDQACAAAMGLATQEFHAEAALDELLAMLGRFEEPARVCALRALRLFLRRQGMASQALFAGHTLALGLAVGGFSREERELWEQLIDEARQACPPLASTLEELLI